MDQLSDSFFQALADLLQHNDPQAQAAGLLNFRKTVDSGGSAVTVNVDARSANFSGGIGGQKMSFERAMDVVRKQHLKETEAKHRTIEAERKGVSDG